MSHSATGFDKLDDEFQEIQNILSTSFKPGNDADIGVSATTQLSTPKRSSPRRAAVQSSRSSIRSPTMNRSSALLKSPLRSTTHSLYSQRGPEVLIDKYSTQYQLRLSSTKQRLNTIFQVAEDWINSQEEQMHEGTKEQFLSDLQASILQVQQKYKVQTLEAEHNLIVTLNEEKANKLNQVQRQCQHERDERLASVRARFALQGQTEVEETRKTARTEIDEEIRKVESDLSRELRAKEDEFRRNQQSQWKATLEAQREDLFAVHRARCTQIQEQLRLQHEEKLEMVEQRLKEEYKGRVVAAERQMEEAQVSFENSLTESTQDKFQEKLSGLRENLEQFKRQRTQEAEKQLEDDLEQSSLRLREAMNQLLGKSLSDLKKKWAQKAKREDAKQRKAFDVVQEEALRKLEQQCHSKMTLQLKEDLRKMEDDFAERQRVIQV